MSEEPVRDPGDGSPAPINVSTIRPRRTVARRPAPRSIEVELESGEYAGWWCRVRVDFPAKVLRELQSNDVERILEAFGTIILEHNMPGADGELAATLGDVDPYDGLKVLAAEAFRRIDRLPPR